MISSHWLPLLYQVHTTHISVLGSKNIPARISGPILFSTLLFPTRSQPSTSYVESSTRSAYSCSLGGWLEVVAGNLVGKVCEGAEDRAGEVFKERDGGSIRPRSSSSGRRHWELGLCDVVGNKPIKIYKALSFRRDSCTRYRRD